MKPNIWVENRCITLQNAMEVGYEMSINEIYTASFSLPVYDSANEYCRAFRLVDFYDGERYIGRFRIKSESSGSMRDSDAVIQYECEHVISYLSDSRIIAEDENKFMGKTVAAIIEKLLAYQTKDKNEPDYYWALGECSHTYVFDEIDEYDIQDADILSSVFDVTKEIDGYYWQYDTNHLGTREDPFLMNFVAFNSVPAARVAYGINEVNLSRDMDTEDMVTRLFVTGSTEDDETTYMKKDSSTASGCTGAAAGLYPAGESPDEKGLYINGKYLISGNADAEYGTIVRTLQKDRIANGTTLRRAAEYYLLANDHPQYTYSCEIVDLYRYDRTNLMEVGTCVSVTDARLGIDIITHVTELAKDDVDGDPLAMSVTLSTRVTKHASGLAKFADRLLGGIR